MQLGSTVLHLGYEGGENDAWELVPMQEDSGGYHKHITEGIEVDKNEPWGEYTEQAYMWDDARSEWHEWNELLQDFKWHLQVVAWFVFKGVVAQQGEADWG